MPSHLVKTFGVCEKMTVFGILGGSSHLDRKGMLMAVDFYSGFMEIHQNDILAFTCKTNYSQARCDLHIPSGIMDIFMRLTGEDVVNVHVKPFLEFYSKYAKAEDDAMELKLARSNDAAGNMRSMTMEVN